MAPQFRIVLVEPKETVVMDHLRELSKEQLLKLVEVYAANWLAHDGCWFLAAEEQYGMETAIALDTKSWERFSPAEAKRIMRAFGIAEGGGVDALHQALGYRLYAAVNRFATERPNDNTLIHKMIDCRVQSARRRKGLADFPCKSVGQVEYSKFAETIDPRIKTRCITCPPDDPPDEECACAWEFSI